MCRHICKDISPNPKQSIHKSTADHIPPSWEVLSCTRMKSILSALNYCSSTRKTASFWHHLRREPVTTLRKFHPIDKHYSSHTVSLFISPSCSHARKNIHSLEWNLVHTPLFFLLLKKDHHFWKEWVTTVKTKQTPLQIQREAAGQKKSEA